MTATFDPLLSTRRDEIRHLLGDTDLTAPLRQDEEYDALLGLESEWRVAAARMAESLAVEYAQRPDSVTIAGEISVSWRERVRTWSAIAARLRAEVAAERAAAAASLRSDAALRDGDEERAEYHRPVWWRG